MGKFHRSSTSPRVIRHHAVPQQRQTGNSHRAKRWTTGRRPWIRTLAHRTPRPPHSLQTTLGIHLRTLRRTHSQALLSSITTAPWVRGQFSNFELKKWEDIRKELSRRWISTCQCALVSLGIILLGREGRSRLKQKKKPIEFSFLDFYGSLGHFIFSCNDMGIKLFLFSYLLPSFALIDVSVQHARKHG